MDILDALNKKFVWDYYEDERNDIAFEDEEKEKPTDGNQ